MSRRDRNQSYYGRNLPRYEGQDSRSRQGRDWEHADRERARSEEWQSDAWRQPDERDYTARYLGYESRNEPQRFPATFGSYDYDDQRRVSRFEGANDYRNEQERGYYAQRDREPYASGRYGSGRDHAQSQSYRRETPSYGVRNDYGRDTRYGQGEWGQGQRDDFRSTRDYGRDLGRDYGREDYGRDYGQEHGRNWGQQLRDAGNEMVRKVKRAFRGPKGYKRSDERIREDVNDRLAQQDDFDPSEIEVSVANGEVTLSGSVRSRHEKFLAEEIADDVSGVGEVHNQIRVQPQPSNVNLSGTTGATTEGQAAGAGWSSTGGKNRNVHS